ncbi:NAD-binding protein [Skermania piniformis]|uniref:NAD-binding protein n=1 Tax=Skermania pinensis TaxID=39122 RepID=A0ABX8SBN0_9ACTN|nr:NAD-binding protein [Skermania piniformis]QXQ14592.1 NAD-binding protein [Skermania piniformis]
MPGHVIVSGDDALAQRIAEELLASGTEVVRIDASAELSVAGIASAGAVVCAGPDDAVNLEISLLAREHNARVRVVCRLANEVLRKAVAAGNGPGAVLDVAELVAPLVVEACLARTAHPIRAAGMQFVVAGADAPRAATLRAVYGDLAPVAVVQGPGSATPGVVTICPGRDQRVQPGDRVAMIGGPDELRARGIAVDPAPRPGGAARAPLRRRLSDGLRGIKADINPTFYKAMAVSLALLIFATVLLRVAYHKPGMSIVDALYFSTETIATVGYGDFSFADQPTWLRLFSIGLMFAGVTTTAVLMAFVADLLLSRRLAESAARRQVRYLSGHVIVVGLGSFGIRVIADLRAAGHQVVAVERDPDNRFRSSAAELGVPVIVGDATLRRTLDDARVGSASAVAVLTQHDMVNIEIGIVLRETLGARWARSAESPGVPVVLRIFDRTLGAAVAARFGFENVRSTVELAAPWFIGAALGLQVFGTFSVGQRSFMVGGVRVEPGSELAGIRMLDLATRTRVIAIARSDGAIDLHPRRDTALAAGDTAYLVGPYRELLATLRQGQAPAAVERGT